MSMSSLKIRGGEVFQVALPIRRPHHWVGHTARIGEDYVVLRLELENGIVGWDEAQVIGTWGGDHGARYGETPKLTATAITEVLLPAIAGRNVTEIAQLHVRMDRVLRGYPYAKAAIDVGHLGEGLPFMLHRINDQTRIAAARRGLKRIPAQYLTENLVVPCSGNFSAPAFLCTVMALGVDNVLFSVDWP